jgi:selenocysteine lyase/cysteine desulfurase
LFVGPNAPSGKKTIVLISGHGGYSPLPGIRGVDGTQHGLPSRSVAAELDPTEEHAKFEVPDGIAYFNVANLAPQLRSVRAAGEAALERRAAPWTIGSADWFTEVERLRELFARLIGADAEGVALVPATSYGMAVAAANLDAGPGEQVLVLAEEYPSGIYTWRAFARRTGAEIRTVRPENGESWTEAILGALGARTRIVSVPNVHWTNGALVDIEAVCERAHELEASLVLDVSQSAGAMPLDVGTLRPDFLVSVGYKWLLGPFSLAYLYVDERHREGEPIEHNWIVRAGAEDFARLVDYTAELQPGARRFDVGARTNFTLAPMAIAALEQVLEWTVAGVAEALAATTAAIEIGACERSLDAIPASERGPHMVGIRLSEPTPAELIGRLAERGVYAGVRSSWLRVSPHLHTTEADLDRLFAALDAALG